MASKMAGLRIDNKAEKSLLVRIGTLVDAIVTAQRGPSNAPNSLQRKANVNNLKKPAKLVGSTENIFNGASVKITPSSTAANLSHYEAQIDTDSNFSDPTSKELFTTGTTFKGLIASTEYHIRIRPITKNGQIGDWAQLDSITTTGETQSADFDGDSGGLTVLSKSFTFESATQDIFCCSNGGETNVLSAAPIPAGDSSGVIRNDTETETDVSYRDRRIGTSTAVQEVIILEGVAPTIVSTFSGKSSIESAYSNMQVIRFRPIIFFNLMEADANDLFPTTYTFDVQVDLAGAGFNSSTQDTTWVQF